MTIIFEPDPYPMNIIQKNQLNSSRPSKVIVLPQTDSAPMTLPRSVGGNDAIINAVGSFVRQHFQTLMSITHIMVLA